MSETIKGGSSKWAYNDDEPSSQAKGQGLLGSPGQPRRPRRSGGGSSPWPDGSPEGEVPVAEGLGCHHSARCPTLHLPQHWPWETQVNRPLTRLRAIPLPARFAIVSCCILSRQSCPVPPLWAATGPIYWNRARTFAFPCPSLLASTPRPHRIGGFGFAVSMVWAHKPFGEADCPWVYLCEECSWKVQVEAVTGKEDCFASKDVYGIHSDCRQCQDRV